MDRHHRVAQQRRQADALGRGRIEARERVDVAGEQHQQGEEEADPGQHRGRPGDDLAVAVAGQVEHPAGGDRQHPGPEQQRAALARPHRGQLVAGRRRGRGVLGDQRDREVRAQEGRLEHDHADGEQRAERVDRAPRRVDQAPVVAAGAERSPRPRRTRRRTGPRSGTRRRARPSGRCYRGRHRAIIATPRVRLGLRRPRRPGVPDHGGSK